MNCRFIQVSLEGEMRCENCDAEMEYDMPAETPDYFLFKVDTRKLSG